MRTGKNAVVYSTGPHYGEEDCFGDTHGSSMVFFSWRNMRCLFSQKHANSLEGHGTS